MTAARDYVGEAVRETSRQKTDKQSDAADWRTDLLLTDKKQPKALLANALIALRHAPEWQGVLAHDEFALATMMMKPAPWLQQKGKWEPRRWADGDDGRVAEWLQRQSISITKNVAADAVEVVATENVFHPIKNYLKSHKWDGASRIEGFASTYLGAESNPYTIAICRSFFVAAVARIAKPGCKHDHVLILEDDQGKRKSQTAEALFAPWFTDEIAELGSKDASMQVRVAWGIEIGELAAMTRGEIERVKAFITRKVDIFRPSYGRRVVHVPRQSVFIGTTNADTYLKDETGGRRFWPIRCNRIDLEAIKRDRDQLWAEAVTLYRAGNTWWLVDAETNQLAEREQATRYAADAWQETISQYLDLKNTASVGDILSNLGLEKAKWGRVEQMRVAACLKVLGWERYRTSQEPRQWRYKRQGTSMTDIRQEHPS
jgi:predicted P-loop ATPase